MVEAIDWVDMDLSLYAIGQSMLTGVMIGITTAVLLGLGGWIRHRWQQREQRIFLRDCIMKCFTMIRNTGPLDPPRPGVEPPSPDNVRWVLFKSFLRDLEILCDHRLSRMDHAMLYDLRQLLMWLNEMVNLFEKQEKCPEGERLYLSFYDHFAKIRWIRLPRIMPTK